MTTEQRLAKLEKQNRWMKRMGGMALAAVACVVLIGQGKPKELPDLVAKSLTIKDADGTVRALLSVQTARPIGGRTVSLVFYDAKGKGRVVFGVDALGTTVLRFRDKDRSTRAMLLLRPDGSPSLSLRDKDRKTRAILRLRPDGSPGLTLSDAKGDVIWQVPPKKCPTSLLERTRSRRESRSAAASGPPADRGRSPSALR